MYNGRTDGGGGGGGGEREREREREKTQVNTKQSLTRQDYFIVRLPAYITTGVNIYAIRILMYPVTDLNSVF